MSNYFKRKALKIANDVMFLDVPLEHLLSGDIVISKKDLEWAKKQGAYIVHVKSGKREYRATLETIRYDGREFGGYYFLPLFRWQKVSGSSLKFFKGALKKADNRIQRRYRSKSIRKKANTRGVKNGQSTRIG